MLRQLLWMVIDAFSCRQPVLTIDPKRINDEVRVERRLLIVLEDDLEQRQRIKDRMLQGKECIHSSWYASNIQKRRKPRRNVVGFPQLMENVHGKARSPKQG